jgi:hypothetical protein
MLMPVWRRHITKSGLCFDILPSRVARESRRLWSWSRWRRMTSGSWLFYGGVTNSAGGQYFVTQKVSKRAEEICDESMIGVR